ncbi:hypothetical protein D3248_02930 [Leucobacter zeae]|nr:hypothetical protein [Leucobacter zeae]
MFDNQRAVAQAAAYLPRLRTDRGECFSHTTALHLYGAPIRAAIELHVTISEPHAVVRLKDVIGHRTQSLDDIRQVAFPGYTRVFPCVPPVVALLQAAPLLTFREQVVAADHLVKLVGPDGHRVPGLSTLDELRRSAGRSTWAGMPRFRNALQVARVGAESRYETLQHFELARMGIDRLELQAVLTDSAGNRIGRFDAVDRERMRVLEFDGEQHRTDRAQYLADVTRLDAARDSGYTVKRTHAEDFAPAALARTRRELREFLRLEPTRISRPLARRFAEPY